MNSVSPHRTARLEIQQKLALKQGHQVRLQGLELPQKVQAQVRPALCESLIKEQLIDELG